MKNFLYQPKSGYCYNSDSIFLFAFIKRFPIKGKVLDVGSGVGILSILIKRYFECDITLIDKQIELLRYAKLNFKINNFKAQFICKDFLDYDGESFDFIVSNPPFYSSNGILSKDKVLNIARYDMHLPLRDFLQKASKLLKNRGYLIFCYDAKRIDYILKYLKEFNIKAKEIRFMHSKIDRSSKVVLIAAQKNSRSDVEILPPFVVFENDSYSKEAKEAFKIANTHSIKGDFCVD